MKIANFILGFDPETRQTIFPLDENGQPHQLDWVHLSLESNNTVLVQVRGLDEVIDLMKMDDTPGRWLEDIQEKIESVAELSREEEVLEVEEPDSKVIIKKEPILKADPIIIKNWIKAELISNASLQTEEILDQKSIVSISSSIEDLDWEDSDKAIENIVILHGQTMEGYKGSGLG